MRSNEEIVEIIDSKRIEKKLSISELARRVGMAKSALSRYFNKTREFPLNKIEDFAKALGVSSEYLLGFNDENERVPSIETIYNQLEEPRQTKVYNFAEYQLKEQQRKSKISIMIKGYVSAGSGEWLESNEEEVEFNGEVPEHDFAVRVNGNSMTPLFDDKQIIFVKGTSEARDGQIVVCRVNSDAYVKKLSGNNLVSLNKDYKDILISETDDFKIFGVVVL